MVQEQIREIDRYHGMELTRVGRAWHELEEANKSGIDIIDFRLAPPEFSYPTNPFRGREDVRNKLVVLAGDIDRSTIDGEYLGSKADSMLMYARILDDPKAVSFERAMEAIAGYTPRAIPRPHLERQRAYVAEAFTQLNSKPFTREGWTEFHADSGITPQQAVREIQDEERSVLFQIVKEIGIRSYPRTEITIDDVEEYWIGWVKADQERAYFRVNAHPVNRMRFYPGTAIKTLYHEDGGHGAQAKSWADNIREGIINPGIGDTMVPGPEQWLLEGWASEITRVRPSVLDQLDPKKRAEVELAVELQYLTDIAFVNAQIEHFGSGRPRESIIRDLQDLLSHEPTDRIELVLKNITERPDRMYYLPAYGDASFTLREDLEPLSDMAKQKFIEKIYKRPLTPTQVKRFLASLAA